jgi:hypothetical protein
VFTATVPSQPSGKRGLARGVEISGPQSIRDIIVSQLGSGPVAQNPLSWLRF